RWGRVGVGVIGPRVSRIAITSSLADTPWQASMHTAAALTPFQSPPSRGRDIPILGAARRQGYRDMNRRELILLLSGAFAAPRALWAQQKAMPVIGYLNGTTPEANAPLLAAFRQALGETGWIEGQNLKIEYRWAEFHYDRLPALAADLVGRKVDVIAACG